MLSWLFFLLIASSLISSIFLGTLPQVSAAAINECSGAVSFTIELLGILCLWSGIMEIAAESGITQKISSLLYGITGRLFRGLDKKSPAMKSISMNITANLLGLGNAATPLGISAMQELEKLDAYSDTASNNMILFVVMNTASLQLLPNTTIAAMRMAQGSASPLDIMPAVLITSFVSLFVAVLSVKLLSRFSKRRYG